jgi:hypothetical protein
LKFSPDIIRIIRTRRRRWDGHDACMEEKRNAYSIFGGKARRTETTRKI